MQHNDVSKKATMIVRRGLIAFTLAANCYLACAQSPVVEAGGIVNAASYAQPVAPGSLVAIFGTNLAQGVNSAMTIPWPTILGGTSVSINGIAAPLYYVSPNQIDAQVPSSLAFSYGGYTTASVVVTTAVGSSTPAAVSILDEGPGVFTTDESGCGQAEALNIAPDGSFSPNSPLRSAAPGDFIAIFGTGFGQSLLPPPADGTPPSAAEQLQNAGGFTLNGSSILPLQYFGLAPGLVGLDQANVQIPSDMRQGCAVPLAIAGESLRSPTVTVSISLSRGQCTDPPTESYGTITLMRTIATGTRDDGETDALTASFPSGPQLTRPAYTQTPMNGYVTNIPQLAAPSRACQVPGYGQLSAGAIVVSAPTGSATAEPTTVAGSATYSLNLPVGFLTGGAYNISLAGSAVIGAFQGSMTVDSPIQVTGYSQAAYNEPLIVQWTGGAATSVVKVSLVAKTGLTQNTAYGYTAATAGSYSFQPICSGNPAPAGNGVYCSFGIPGLSEVVVEQMPATDQVSTFQASGITSDIRAYWIYRYVIGIGQN
jgi:uncharacterized protein (TIGR03437 family)